VCRVLVLVQRAGRAARRDLRCGRNANLAARGADRSAQRVLEQHHALSWSAHCRSSNEHENGLLRRESHEQLPEGTRNPRCRNANGSAGSRSPMRASPHGSILSRTGTAGRAQILLRVAALYLRTRQRLEVGLKLSMTPSTALYGHRLALITATPQHTSRGLARAPSTGGGKCPH